MSGCTIRPATPADADAITALIARSVHGLQASDYSQAQRDAAIGQVFLVDHGLIADGTYFVVESADGLLAAAGGWSTRKASHGGHVHGDDGSRIDPAVDPARIRAFFVDPDFARQGLGARLLLACEEAARAAGFSRAMMGATLTGVPLYAAHGYREYGREEAPPSRWRNLDRSVDGQGALTLASRVGGAAQARYEGRHANALRVSWP